MLVSAFESKKIDYDFIVVSSFETIMFVIGRYFFKKDDKIILFHHFNTDELNNKIKAWFFRRYMNKVTHIVFAEFIKDYLINNFDINPKKIFVMPHHMNIIDENTTMKKEFDCVGLSNSNDEEIISEILQKEKQEKVFKKMGCKVVLKSKIHEFDDGYLKIVKGYLEKEVFDNYINNTQSIYMPFPSSFQYRMSGTLIDALSNGKIVYGSDIPVMRYYSKRHPNICKVVDNADSFINKLLNKKDNISDYTKDFERFKQEHSEEKIEGVFRKIFNSIQ
ncbi:MAG: hypothetical protein GX327_09650 [Epulopiscium sp.]|nr:hypothetical protein [Candidatus Epulonipiscium sp.]